MSREVATMAASQAVEPAPAVPPFRPDPELIGNIEGNDRVRDEDRAKAREYLERHDLTSPADDAEPRKYA